MGEYKDLTNDKFDYFCDKPFSYYRIKLNPSNGAGDCMIRAIMQCINKTTADDWKYVYDSLYKTSVSMYKVFNDIEVAQKLLEEWGFEYTELPIKNRVNMKRFAETHLKGHYIVIFDRHAVAYIDGVIFDDRRLSSNKIAQHTLEDTYLVYRYFKRKEEGEDICGQKP